MNIYKKINETVNRAARIEAEVTAEI